MIIDSSNRYESTLCDLPARNTCQRVEENLDDSLADPGTHAGQRRRYGTDTPSGEDRRHERSPPLDRTGAPRRFQKSQPLSRRFRGEECCARQIERLNDRAETTRVTSDQRVGVIGHHFQESRS